MKKIILGTLLISALSVAANAQTSQKIKTSSTTPPAKTEMSKPKAAATGTQAKPAASGKATTKTYIRPKHRKHPRKAKAKKTS